MKICLCGPMTGRPNRNAEAYHAAAAQWRAAGHAVLNPHELGATEPTITGEAALRLGMSLVCQADALALLAGWEQSRGALIEIAVAVAMQLPIYDAENQQPITPLRAAWRVDQLAAPRLDAEPIRGGGGESLLNFTP